MKLFRDSQIASRNREGFTLLEIAVSLAVIGFAIVAVIGVLPTGLNIQRDTRERTVILQDASYFIETIRRGAQGTNDLVNYVENIWQARAQGTTVVLNRLDARKDYKTDDEVIRLLTTPQAGKDANYLYTVALVRSLSGPSSEKGFSSSSDRIAFRYFIKTEVRPIQSVPSETFVTNEKLDRREFNHRARQLTIFDRNLSEMRFSVLWPAYPPVYEVGWTPRNQVDFRTYVSGELNAVTNAAAVGGWVFKPRRFL